MRRNVEDNLECQAMCLDNSVIHCANMDITVPEEFTWKSIWHWHWWYLVMLRGFQHLGETVHRHVSTIVTLLATVMTADIIKPANRTFRDVPKHIQHSGRYWPHFKVLCEFGILTWFYSNYLYGHTTYFILHGIFVVMVRVALVRLIRSTSSWLYQLMSNTRTMARRGSP